MNLVKEVRLKLFPPVSLHLSVAQVPTLCTTLLHRTRDNWKANIKCSFSDISLIEFALTIENSPLKKRGEREARDAGEESTCTCN